jgi:hypothetical protein
VTWTITANGKAQKAYGELLPVEEITERIIMTRGNLNPGDDDPNKPPVIAIAPVAAAALNAPIVLTATVSDDGLPKPRPAAPVKTPAPGDATAIQAQANASIVARPRGLTVSWMQIRGPAKISFEPAGATSVADGKADVTVRFSERGTYVVRATANDGALSTKADLTMTVASSSAAGR